MRSLLSNLTHFFSVLAPPPQEMGSSFPPCLRPLYPSLPYFVLHISLLIALISTHTLSTIHRTSSIVSKLTFGHYHLNLNLSPQTVCCWLFDCRWMWATYRETTLGKQYSLGLYSLGRPTSYRKISWSLEAIFRLLQSFSNLTGTLAAVLQRCLSNFRVTQSL